MKKAYSIHMIGWMATKSAYSDPSNPFSGIADSCRYANIDAGRLDSRPEVASFTIIYGVLGGF